MIELFEHTADLGLRVRAADLDSLFRESAEGLFSIIAEGFDEAAASEPIELRIEAARRDYLLFDWLNELLYISDSRRLLLGCFEVRVGQASVTGRARAEPLDESRHRLHHEVKAITYHGLRVERDGEGWLAEVIVDI